MRKARSQPLGATRFRSVQVLGELGLYADRIEAHRRETRLREQERAARAGAEREAARAAAEREAARALREREAFEHMSEGRRAAWLWEVRITSWLTDTTAGEGQGAAARGNPRVEPGMPGPI